MSVYFEPTKSKNLFVGRQGEIEIFTQILDGQRPEWIIHVPGPGGAGKTRLLERFREVAQQRSNLLVTNELVDFFKVKNQTGFGLLQEIASQLGVDKFPTFANERKEFAHLLDTEPDPSERQEGVNRVMDAFLGDYKILLHRVRQVLLLFDTCEEMGAVESYILETLLPALWNIEQKIAEEFAAKGEVGPRHFTVIAMVGRKRLEFGPELAGQVWIHELPALSQQDVAEFFRQGGLGASAVSEDALVRILELTSGRPLYVALSFDWLKNKVGTVAELLSLEEPIGKKLVEWVRRLDTTEKQAILYTALGWRRMESSLLARLLSMAESDARQVIENLSRFSFVKYRPAKENFPGSFQLHDEMRDLVSSYVWPQEGRSTQSALFRQVAGWYEEQIGSPELLRGAQRPETDEERSLLAEWLYYQCQLDLDRAVEYHERLFRPASHYLDLAFCDLLNQEMERFKEGFSASQKDDLRYREALVAFRREQIEQASSIWHSLLRRPDLRTQVRAVTNMMLTELEAQRTPDGALEHARESEKTYQELIGKETDPTKRSQWESELGQCYNNYGFAHRVKGANESALEYYNRALDLPLKPKNVARTLNNIGFVCFLQGDIEQALTNVGRALQIRRRLKIPYELGLGNNTLGIIMEQRVHLDDAADLYHKALLDFQAARSEQGKALVLLNLGRLARVTNDYDKALEHLEKARKVFEWKKNKDGLIKALNEEGCAYRQRGETGDREKAEELLKASLAQSEELGRTLDQTDNWEDLAILYTRWASEARERGDGETWKERAQAARESAKQVSELGTRYGHTYLLAKNEQTLGDLDYAEGKLEEAFGHYLEACRLMAQAKKDGKDSPVKMQRRYEEMVDRLQEQLQALPDEEETERLAQKLNEQVKRFKGEEKANLQSVTAFLAATIKMAQSTRKFFVKGTTNLSR